MRPTLGKLYAIDGRRLMLQRAGPLPDVPMIVLTGTAAEPLPISAELARTLVTAKVDLHAAPAATVSQGEQRILDDAGHRIRYQRPDAIIDAVRDVLDRIGGR